MTGIGEHVYVLWHDDMEPMGTPDMVSIHHSFAGATSAADVWKPGNWTYDGDGWEAPLARGELLIITAEELAP